MLTARTNNTERKRQEMTRGDYLSIWHSVCTKKTLKEVMQKMVDIALAGNREALQYIIDRSIGKIAEDNGGGNPAIAISVYIPERRVIDATPQNAEPLSVA